MEICILTLVIFCMEMNLETSSLKIELEIHSGKLYFLNGGKYFRFLMLISILYFRWKGENVSTTEIEAVISNIVHLNDAVVFGVEVNHVISM